MDIELFNKRYVYLEWSDELEGKDCILAKSYKDLKDFVNSGDKDRFCKVHKGKEKPFTNLWSECDFCYFDSNLAVKKALLEGNVVQFYNGNSDKWEDLDLDLEYCDIEDYLDNEDWDEYEWRIKPTTEEKWYVCLVDGNFVRVPPLSYNIRNVFFHDTYDECGKWIDEHNSLSDVFSAFLRGDTIQWKPKNKINKWQDWKSSEVPTVNTTDENYWRIKPTKEMLFVNVYHHNGVFKLQIRENADTSIFCGTRKHCEYVVNKINKNFVYANCLHKCKGNHCNNCVKLLALIKNIEFKTIRRMTNKELAEWLAKGNGEVKHTCDWNITVDHFHNYFTSDEDKEVNDNVSIRKWDSDKWEEPLIEI